MKKNLLFLLLFCVSSFSFVWPSEIRGTVKSSEGVLENAVVYIDKIEGKTFRPPEEPRLLAQNGLVFVPHVLPILVGTEVNFPNKDVVLHNVFSPGYTSRFNLGTYSQGTSKTKVFDKSGIVLLLCNIHHEMSAFIVIAETPYFSVTDEEGKYSIRNVPPGEYKLLVWHERMMPQIRDIEVLEQDLENVNFLLIEK